MMMSSLGLLIALSSYVSATEYDQAKRIHQRLSGVPATAAVLEDMANFIKTGDGAAATAIAMADDGFYNVTLKNFATPWTNESQTVFADLNDYTATVIGMVRDDVDFRQILSADTVYVAEGISGLSAYSMSNNSHYEQLDAGNYSLQTYLVAKNQSDLTSLPSDATAGVMTSRAASKAFFIDGTNRAMLRFTLINHLCRDLEAVKDITRPADRIRQDVSRSPGGDSRIFLNTCIGCHTGMDPLAQAFAYYDYSYDSEADEMGDAGQLVYTPGAVQEKYHFNNANFAPGFVTKNDQWDNYWRAGQNKLMGWSQALTGSGQGAKSMGTELANSDAFAQCQVKKVFENVCLKKPINEADSIQVNLMKTRFIAANYSMKTAFSDASLYCSGD
ncbi:MAG: hypothetical protein HRU20_11695 [Pseudomonadales bacterium]|nr:hypothetical protein [Pseudomonadales bacterium]